jgi:hypothetical protein
MKLEEYLDSIKNCEDDALGAKFGINNNFPIFLKAEFSNVLQLIPSRGYNLDNSNVGRKGVTCNFSYKLGTIEMQVYNWIPPIYCLGTEVDKQRQLKEYNMTMMLQWWNENRIEVESKPRIMAIALARISKMIIEEKIPACMPSSIGWNYTKEDIITKSQRIVYHDP